MEPTIKRGEKISVNYAAYLTTAPQRWDVVAFEHPSLTNQVWVKRVVALPGETVTFATGGVTINGVRLISPPNVSNVVYVSVDYFGRAAVGSTVASLGDPSQPGFWVKTPLVQSDTNGRIVNPANGKSAKVRLIPLGGAAGGGSQVSLPALQLIGVSLTDLPTVEVYAG